MLSRVLAIGLLPAPPSTDIGDAPSTAPPATTTLPLATAEPKKIPWNLLVNRRLVITTAAGTTSEGIFLGLEGDAAILEADGGALISIARDDVANVHTVKAAPPPPAIPIASNNLPLSLS